MDKTSEGKACTLPNTQQNPPNNNNEEKVDFNNKELILFLQTLDPRSAEIFLKAAKFGDAHSNNWIVIEDEDEDENENGNENENENA